ncbi:MAG: hypothetical protein AAGF23_02210 [Acidobacteriota bacterium]
MPHSQKPAPLLSTRPRDARAAAGDASVPRRTAYRAPAIVCRQRIETMAADCTIPGGKNDATCILGFS